MAIKANITIIIAVIITIAAIIISTPSAPCANCSA